MAVSLSKGQRVSLDKGMSYALVGLGWDVNQYDGSADFDLDAIRKDAPAAARVSVPAPAQISFPDVSAAAVRF